MELTFAQRWRENHIPLRDYELSPVDLESNSGVNTAINGIPLPHLWSSHDAEYVGWVNLLPSNRDWVPFFSEPDVADHVMSMLGEFMETAQSGVSYSLLFQPRANAIWAIYDAGEDSEFPLKDDPDSYFYGIASYKIGDFNSTVRQLENNIKTKMQPETYVDAGDLTNGIPPVPDKIAHSADFVEWFNQGETPKTSLGSYKLAKSLFESMYLRKTPLSEVPDCHE